MFRLIEPALGRVSGGLRYNHAVAAAAGEALTVQQLAGTWPDPTANDVAALQQMVEHSDGPILLDGLIGCSLPSPVQASVPIVQLVHALAEDPKAQWREALNLRAASAVVTTSQFAADQLYRRHGIEAVAARPGVEPRRLALGHDGSKLICVGAVEPNKNQLFLADVLDRFGQRDDIVWQCTFAGPLTDPAYAQQVRRALEPFPQATLAGELYANELSELYYRADLLLLPSRAETYGLVVNEATAAGIPAFVTTGTGAEEALGAGEALPLDEHVWAAALHRWATDKPYRTALQHQAHRAREQLQYGWEPTAQRILRVLKEVL